MTESDRKPLILIADDDETIRKILTIALKREGYEVKSTEKGLELAQWLENGLGDLVISDVMMPDVNGLDLLPQLLRLRPQLPIVIISARSTLDTAVRAFKEGAADYVAKPFDLSQIVNIANKILKENPATNSKELKKAVYSVDGGSAPSPARLIGQSRAMQDIYRTMARLMHTDFTVLIQGESGTGKELIARALHEGSRWSEGPFVAVNMAAIPRDLIESELFGHERGAFTGATQRKTGRFEQARGGTLFLDEIGDMPLEAQTRLLRVLQEGEYTAVGGTRSHKSSVRIIAATHRDLPTMVRHNQFREDLYYRLSVIPLKLPPLRDRMEDLPDLARFFFEKAGSCKVLTAEALGILRGHFWPGNIRELENLVRRLCVLCSRDIIDASDVSAALDSGSPGLGAKGTMISSEQAADSVNTAQPGLGDLVRRSLEGYFANHAHDLPPPGLHGRIVCEVEKPLIELTLRATNGNQIRAAELLGLNRNTLRKKIRDLSIDVVRETKGRHA